MLHRCLVLIVVIAVSRVTVGVAGEERVRLRYRFSKASPLAYRNVTKDKQTLTIREMDLEEVTEKTVDFRYALQDVGKSGNLVVTRTYQRIQEKVTASNGSRYRFDSQQDKHDRSSALGKKRTPTNEALIGAAVKVTFSPRGQAMRVEGFRKLLVPVLMKEPTAANRVNGGGNEHEQYAVTLRFPVLPVEAVKPEDEWESAVDISFAKGTRVTGKRKYVFESWETVASRKLAKIAITSELEFRREENRDEGKFRVVAKSRIVSSSGEALFDVKNGNLYSLKDEFHTLGETTVYVDGKETLSVGLKSTQTIETALREDE